MKSVRERIRAARRVGVFGGTFDPVHVGHLHAARCAREHGDLDLVVLVPAARSPHKSKDTVATGAERLEMLRLAVADEPGFAVWDFEVERGAPSYTVETLREVRRLRGEREDGDLALVLGSDNLGALDRWTAIEEVLTLARPLVVLRAGEDGSRIADLDLSEAARERLRDGFVREEPVDAAATPTRERLARDEPAPEVPPAVREYAEARGIYRAMDADGSRREGDG